MERKQEGAILGQDKIDISFVQISEYEQEDILGKTKRYKIGFDAGSRVSGQQMTLLCVMLPQRGKRML